MQKKIFLLATGAPKGKVLSTIKNNTNNYMNLPVCLTWRGTWLLDSDASKHSKNL
jgi:6-phosphogluconolactonase/glucosamine-6-phosphate isomerase/deaminase